MKHEKVITLLLLGFGILGILYYLGNRKKFAAGGSGPLSNAGGGSITPAARSAAAGTSGSIPNIIASAAALIGKSAPSPAPNYGPVDQNPIISREVATGDAMAAFGDSVDGTPFGPDASSGTAATGLVSLESAGTLALPGLGALGPDVASQVSSLDVGGLDYGTVYA